MFANILQKNVDDDVTEVHDDPFGRRRAFSAEGRVSLDSDSVAHVVRDSPNLTFRSPEPMTK